MKPPNMDTQRDVEETDQLPLPQREVINMLERKKERKKERKTHETTKYGYTERRRGNRPAPSSTKRGDHYARKKKRKKERRMKPPNMDTQGDVDETDQLPLPQREVITMLERKKERKKDEWNHQIWIHKETTRNPTSSLFPKESWSLC